MSPDNDSAIISGEFLKEKGHEYTIFTSEDIENEMSTNAIGCKADLLSEIEVVNCIYFAGEWRTDYMCTFAHSIAVEHAFPIMYAKPKRKPRKAKNDES